VNALSSAANGIIVHVCVIAAMRQRDISSYVTAVALAFAHCNACNAAEHLFDDA